MTSHATPLPEPKPSGPAVSSHVLSGTLSFNEKLALRQAPDLAGELHSGEGTARGEFGELIARRIGATGAELSIQLRPVPPKEVSGPLDKVLAALDAVPAREAGGPRGPTVERYNFSGYPVIALVTEGLGRDGSSMVGLHCGVFDGEAASIPLPISKGEKTVVEDIIISPTCGRGTIALNRWTPTGTIGTLQSFDGQLKATISHDQSGNVEVSFHGTAALAEHPVWFAFIDPATGKVLSGVRADGGRGQGNVELGGEGIATTYLKKFRLPPQSELVFVLGQKD